MITQSLSGALPRIPQSARRTEGLFARMVRLWIEHNALMAEMGIGPH